jgi:hypothetical protein
VKLNIRTLLSFQLSFALASVTFLGVSAWREATMGAPLSAAPILPSILMFVVYAACLLLPRFSRLTWYRIAMAFAVLTFGGGGVIGNIARYVESGIQHYASFEMWLLAVAINSYGTLFNLMAVFGWFISQQRVARSK